MVHACTRQPSRLPKTKEQKREGFMKREEKSTRRARYEKRREVKEKAKKGRQENRKEWRRKEKGQNKSWEGVGQAQRRRDNKRRRAMR